ncbi:hypothetical protein Hanom_Chr08g00756231 [Helianthus anomalus]
MSLKLNILPPPPPLIICEKPPEDISKYRGDDEFFANSVCKSGPASTTDFSKFPFCGKAFPLIIFSSIKVSLFIIRGLCIARKSLGNMR